MKSIYNIAILYDVFTICHLIIRRFNCKDLWHSLLLLLHFINVIQNLMQSIKSFICISEAQETLHTIQLQIFKEHIYTFLCSLCAVKPQHEDVVSLIVKRVVICILKFIISFWDNLISWAIKCLISILNCISTTICCLLIRLHLNEWWG